jgi:hypothetical protein
MFLRIIIYVLLITIPIKVFAKCDFKTSNYLNELKDPKNINIIAIKIPKSEEYIKNFLKIKITSEDEKIILKKLKKRFYAEINVEYDFGICKYEGSVRQHGDWPDHIKIENGKLIRSLDVRLNNGNILNSVKFKLLIPETRNNHNEILGILIIKELGFITPDTFEVLTEINGVKSLMLFQEKSEKELLEKNKRRVGPIFEGDEELLWRYKDFDLFELENISLAKLLNENWFNKGNTHQFITLKSFQKLQNAYLESYTIKNKKKFKTLIFPNSKKNQTFNNYHLLLESMNGWHALRLHNRKYYYNLFTQNFEPIYYDGRLELTWPLQKLNDTFYSKLQVSSINNYLLILNNQNFRHKLYNNYKSKVIQADDNFFSESLDQITNNLEMIRNKIKNKPTKLIKKNNNREIYFKNHKKHKLDQLIIENISKQNNNDVYKIEIRSILNNKIINKDIISSELGNILSNNLIDNQRTIFLPKNEISSEKKIIKKNFLNGEMYFTENLLFQINENEKKIEIQQSEADDWVLFSNLNLEEWKFSFNGKSTLNDSEIYNRMNNQGMTGCLNFYNVKFNNNKFDIQNGRCEDSLNIVNSFGKISKINIISAFSDALDIDFSNIFIEDVSIHRAGNDCVDFSGGNYEVNEFNLKNCGDKGVSIGEQSNITIHNILVENANIGVASKDSSKSLINKAIIKKVEICLSSYNKKQEFFGSNLIVKNIDCKNYLTDKENDEFSNIIYDNDNLKKIEKKL